MRGKFLVKCLIFAVSTEGPTGRKFFLTSNWSAASAIEANVLVSGGMDALAIKFTLGGCGLTMTADSLVGVLRMEHV